MSAPLVAGVELGGTKCVCILGTGPDDVRDEVRIPTTTPDETLSAASEVLRGWAAEERLAGLGVGTFGPVDLDPASPALGSILKTPKPGWAGADLTRLNDGLDLPLVFDTDVNAAALAEGAWGGARGLDSFAYVTVGTGVGVGLVVAGKTVAGLSHPEVGHLRVPRMVGDTWPGSCPYHGDCVEGLAAGSAIGARAGQPADTLDPDHPAWMAAAHALGNMAASLVLTVAPRRILFGGGVPTGQPWLLPRIRTALIESLAGYPPADAVEADEGYLALPALGGRAGPLGALSLGLAAAGRQA